MSGIARSRTAMAAASSGVLFAASLALLVPMSAQAGGSGVDAQALASGTAGSSQTVTVPTGVCGASFDVRGGAGAAASAGGIYGGEVFATLPTVVGGLPGLVAGDVLTLQAGGSGLGTAAGTGGYANGGDGGSSAYGGGAASALKLGNTAILIAGGGGGSGFSGSGGAGGGGSQGAGADGNLTGTSGGNGGPGGGFSAVAASAGVSSTVANDGGGGAGYNGGGAGSSGAGGGGGSNYVASSASLTVSSNGPASAVNAGYVSVTWAACAAPTAPTVTAGSVTASSLSFTFPAATPSATVQPVTGYYYQLNNSGTWTSFTPTGSGTLTGTISNLSPGTSYSLSVAFGYVPPNIYVAPNPSNATSYSASSPVSMSTSVAAAPGAPTSVVVTPGSHQLAVSWVAPTSSGSSPITSYTATASNGASCTTTTTSCVIPGLTPGTFYTVTVTATNSVGTSAPSTVTASVSPLTPSAAAPSSPPSGASALQLSLGVSTTSNAHPGDAVLVQGTGFAPNSLVDVFVYSTPTFLGTGTVNASGAFSFSVNLPSGLAVGAHTVVASGFDPQGVAKFASAGITVGSTALGATGVDASHSSALAAGIGLLGMLLLVLARRRTTRVALRTSSAKDRA